MKMADKAISIAYVENEIYAAYAASYYHDAACALGGAWHQPPESDGSSDPSGVYIFPDGSKLHVTCSYAEVVRDPAQVTGACAGWIANL